MAMRAAVAVAAVTIAGAESWLTCPPSFDARPGRTQAASEGPCESLMHLPAGTHPHITAVRAGQRLKVGWAANNQADGLVRLALVPAGSRNDAAAYDRAVLKVACYGRDCRPGASFAGFCSHPCNARGPWVPSIVDEDEDAFEPLGAVHAAALDEAGASNKQANSKGLEADVGDARVAEDMLRYDTTLGIPTNVLGRAESALREVGPRGGELHVLQLKMASRDASVSYSCALLEILPGKPPGGMGPTVAALIGRPAGDFEPENALPWHDCKEHAHEIVVPECMGADTASGASAQALMAHSKPGPFCYDGHTDGDWDAEHNWPVNAACDPRSSCALAPSPDACAAEVSAHKDSFVVLRVPNAHTDLFV